IAAEVRSRSLHVRPRVPGVRAECVYVRREALELAGPFDQGFFARLGDRGLAQVVADDVVVLTPDVDGDEATESEAHARSLNATRRVARSLSLVIDARMGAGQVTGTQRHVVELVRALAETSEVTIRVVTDGGAQEA